MDMVVKLVMGLAVAGVLSAFQLEIIQATLTLGMLFCRVVLGWRFP